MSSQGVPYGSSGPSASSGRNRLLALVFIGAAVAVFVVLAVRIGSSTEDLPERYSEEQCADLSSRMGTGTAADSDDARAAARDFYAHCS